jgi:hypothetical protein
MGTTKKDHEEQEMRIIKAKQTKKCEEGMIAKIK